MALVPLLPEEMGAVLQGRPASPAFLSLASNLRRAMMVDAKRLGPAAASERFERFETRLREDLGLDPAPETVRLRRSLLDPGADAP